MTKRLQVILRDSEYQEIRRMARSQHVFISKWVRQALGLARPRKTVGSVSKKLEAIRLAVQHEFPVPDMEENS